MFNTNHVKDSCSNWLLLVRELYKHELYSIPICLGSNKGIGYAIAKQLARTPGIEVILTSRDVQRGHEAVANLHKYLSISKKTND